MSILAKRFRELRDKQDNKERTPASSGIENINVEPLAEDKPFPVRGKMVNTLVRGKSANIADRYEWFTSNESVRYTPQDTAPYSHTQLLEYLILRKYGMLDSYEDINKVRYVNHLKYLNDSKKRSELRSICKINIDNLYIKIYLNIDALSNLEKKLIREFYNKLDL